MYKRQGDASNDAGTAVATDRNGGAFLTGQFAGAIDFGGGPVKSAGGVDTFLARLDGDGEHVFSAGFGDAGSPPVIASITSTADGGVLLYRRFTGTVDFGGGAITANGEDGFLTRYAADGTHRWTLPFTGVGEQGPWSVAEDPTTGDLVAVGSFTNQMSAGDVHLTSAGGTDVFVMRVNADNGEPVDGQRFGGAAFDYADDVAVDAAGRVFVAGYSGGALDFGAGPPMSSSGGTWYGYLAAFDDAGPLYQVPFPGQDETRGSHVAVDSDTGAVYVAITLRGWTEIGGNDVGLSAGSVLVRLDAATGAYAAHRPLAFFSSPRALDVTVAGDVVVAGSLNGPCDFGSGTVAPVNDPDGTPTQDGVVASYGPDLSLRGLVQVGTDGGDNLIGVAAVDGGVVAQGYFAGTYAPPGCLPLESAGDGDVIVMKLAF